MTALTFAVLLALSADEPPLGTKPPEWELTDWLNSKPLALKDLAGKVVLVRWWTGPGCALCEATAPALNEFHALYKDKGLVVIGAYHHKSPEPLDPAKVKDAAAKLGFAFPVAIDPDWKTLTRWWLDGGKRRYTSVTFLLDRKGVVQHVHPGGQFVKGDDGYRAIKEKIEATLGRNGD